MPFIRALLILTLPLMTLPSLVAQPRPVRNNLHAPGYIGPGPAWRGDLGPGIGWSYYNLPGGPTTHYAGPSVGLWGFGFPAAARGAFWTNGLSLYGPGVPTYAPIPGVFGGSDAHRHVINPPILGWGTGWFGPLSPSPRRVPQTVSVHPPATSICEGGPAPSSPRCARLTVRLPNPQAELWIDRRTTSQQGSERAFESPELNLGESYQYKLIAQWVENGQERAESREVTVQAGKSMIVDFSIPK
jgi:uncharacterized protein (TIGR03000 family)